MASLLALLSSAMWGTADFFAGRLSKKFHPFAVLGLSQVFGLLTGIVIVLISGDWHGQALGTNGYLISGALAGLFGYLGLACLYEGLSTGRMGVVSPISSMSTVIPLVYALVTGDKLSTLASIGIVVALIGVFCASGPELSNGLPIKPLLLALGAAVGFGLALTFIAIGSESSALLTMVSMRATTFFVTISIAIKFRTTGGFSKQDMPILIFIGAADFIANLLLGVATTKGLVSVAMVFGSLYPIATALLAFKFLNERLHKVQYVGIVLAVSGVSLISAF
jgi:drug/metabolite transporter (DMT)-like permease